MRLVAELRRLHSLVTSKGVIAASIVGGLVAVGALVYFLAPGIVTGRPVPNIADEPANNTRIAGEPPTMYLLLLETAEDVSPSVASYEANNTAPIQLRPDAHIRFESPDHRTPESIRAVARDIDTGEIVLLRKSYDVNNQFFVYVDKGHYDIQLQATWAEKGSFMYKFDVLVV